VLNILTSWELSRFKEKIRRGDGSPTKIRNKIGIVFLCVNFSLAARLAM